MRLDTGWTEYLSAQETVTAYRARPAAADERLPAVVVIQEVWGVDEHIRDVCERFATAGYEAVAPDLYSRGKRPPGLSPQRIHAAKAFVDTLPPGAWMDEARRDKALSALSQQHAGEVEETLGLLFSPTRPMERYTQDLSAAVHELAQDPGCTGRVGSVGFCLGGGLSARLAGSEPDLGACVIFYGQSPAPELVATINCPVLGLYGAEDPRVTDGVPAFSEAMKKAEKSFEHFVYAGAPHAFFNDTRSSYTVAAARDAWARTLAFFAKHLVAASP